MYLLISTNGQISLEESDNMRAFSIVEEDHGLAAKHLPAIGEPAGEQHYWLDADAVIELSGRADDQGWVEDFWGMLAKAEPYGYSNIEERLIKAHVEQPQN